MTFFLDPAEWMGDVVRKWEKLFLKRIETEKYRTVERCEEKKVGKEKKRRIIFRFISPKLFRIIMKRINYHYQTEKKKLKES